MMISANFVAAVVTVVLRGLADRFLLSIQAPVEESSVIPSSTSTFLASGVLFWLYKKLIKGRRVKVLCHGKSRKILDGRLHKSGQLSSQSSVTSWSFRRRRSRSRSDVGTTNNTSLERLRDSSSACSLSTKSACSDYCPCNENSTKENSPSVFSIKSDSNADDATSIKDDDLARFKGYGDWDGNINNKRKIMRKKKSKTTRKTRSGRVYSLYM